MKSSKRCGRNIIFLIVIVTLSVGVTMLITYHFQWFCSPSHDTNLEDARTKIPAFFVKSEAPLPTTVTDIATKPLDINSEELQKQLKSFESTLKSCLGSYCMTEEFSSTTSPNKIERFGFLTPDPLHQSLFTQFLSSWQERSKEPESRQYLVSSHVPAYGYGRNHGFTKIIRIVDNIVLQSVRLSSKALNASNINIDYQSADFRNLLEINLRQLIRWNCRLNHVSAHTALLTVFFEDILHHPFQILQVLSFLQKKKLDNQLVTALLKDYESLFGAIQKEYRFFRENSPIPLSVLEHAASIISNEMSTSNSLSKWPCKSFKDFDRFAQPLLQRYPNLPINQYYDLAADCSDPFVRCSVQYDVNEQKPKVAL